MGVVSASFSSRLYMFHLVRGWVGGEWVDYWHVMFIFPISSFILFYVYGVVRKSIQLQKKIWGTSPATITAEATGNFVEINKLKLRTQNDWSYFDETIRGTSCIKHATFHINWCIYSKGINWTFKIIVWKVHFSKFYREANTEIVPWFNTVLIIYSHGKIRFKNKDRQW